MDGIPDVRAKEYINSAKPVTATSRFLYLLKLIECRYRVRYVTGFRSEHKRFTRISFCTRVVLRGDVEGKPHRGIQICNTFFLYSYSVT